LIGVLVISGLVIGGLVIGGLVIGDLKGWSTKTLFPIYQFTNHQ